MQLSAAIIGQFMSKFESKNLSDKFLPVWNRTSLQNRFGFSPLQATVFLQQVKTLQRARTVKTLDELPKATQADYDTVVCNVYLQSVEGAAAQTHGAAQRSIDEFFILYDIWCNPTKVSRLLKGVNPGKRSRILSEESISMITDIMYCATASTNCKPLGTMRRLVRACAMLEKRFQSYAAYLQRFREVPVLVEGSRSNRGIAILYESDSQANPRHSQFSQQYQC